ncbi:MAG: rhomboid family intramembrane serine protease [bacterium]|nr:rhomboid family intramembrane serine protease [bacterium]
MLDLFAFTGRFDSAKVWQPLTHLLLHFDLLHLLSNLGLLGLLTVYERRVGHARYLAVLAVAGLASIPSVWMYSEPVLVCGISGGLLGLAAAYFTDHKELSRREWAVAVVVFLALFLILSLIDEIRTGGPGGAAGPLSYQIDHIGHLLGAAAGLVYCRLRPRD